MPVTKWDDYLLHQNFSTLDKIQSDGTNAFERSLIVCVSPDGKLQLDISVFIYPNRKITDVGIGIRYGNTQRSMFISRPMDPENDRDDFRLGPFHAKIVEPMKRWQIDLAENDYGIGCSLKMEGRSAPWEAGDWVAMSKDFYQAVVCQALRFSGTITFESKEYSVNGCVGVKDRSWGIRPGAGPSIESEAPITPALAMENWIAAHFQNYSFNLIGTVMNPAVVGKEMEFFVSNIVSDDGTVMPLGDVHHRVEFLEPFEKHREYTKEEFLLKDPAGKKRHLVIRPISRPFSLFAMGWFHGMLGKDFGGFHMEGNQLDASKPAPLGDERWLNQHRVCECQLDGDKGVAFVESIFCQLPDWKYKPTW